MDNNPEANEPFTLLRHAQQGNQRKQGPTDALRFEFRATDPDVAHLRRLCMQCIFTDVPLVAMPCADTVGHACAVQAKDGKEKRIGSIEMDIAEYVQPANHPQVCHPNARNGVCPTV